MAKGVTAMRLIDADALMVSKQWENCTCPAQVIHNAPTIAPESLRPKGRWVYDQYNMEWACSECFEAAHVGIGETCGYILSDYCPNCGAKMEG